MGPTALFSKQNCAPQTLPRSCPEGSGSPRTICCSPRTHSVHRSSASSAGLLQQMAPLEIGSRPGRREIRRLGRRNSLGGCPDPSRRVSGASRNTRPETTAASHRPIYGEAARAYSQRGEALGCRTALTPIALQLPLVCEIRFHCGETRVVLRNHLPDGLLQLFHFLRQLHMKGLVGGLVADGQVNHVDPGFCDALPEDRHELVR
mmetsp:Transcript_2109/g.3907  ORF Transcript_2109/g.3907 Transcript_2109/m.3907 type:complete len:205 (-) Transcript_2109:164-778(-)